MKRLPAETPDNLTDEERETIEALFKYPSLEKVFDPSQPQSLGSLKQKMRSTVAELERIVRRGAQAEAEKATRIIAAYQATLDFLEDLERRRKGASQ